MNKLTTVYIPMVFDEVDDQPAEFPVGYFHTERQEAENFVNNHNRKLLERKIEEVLSAKEWFESDLHKRNICYGLLISTEDKQLYIDRYNFDTGKYSRSTCTKEEAIAYCVEQGEYGFYYVDTLSNIVNKEEE